jgi:hypothetical protein
MFLSGSNVLYPFVAYLLTLPRIYNSVITIVSTVTICFGQYFRPSSGSTYTVTLKVSLLFPFHTLWNTMTKVYIIFTVFV